MSKHQFKPSLLAAAVAALLVPLASHAAEADINARIEALTKQLEDLKAQVQQNQQAAQKEAERARAEVQRVEDRSVGRWLTVGGSYQFRVDNLRGETKPYTDVNALFSTAQAQLQGAFFADPSPANAAMLSGLMQFAGGMSGVQTFEQAQAFLGANAQTLQGLGSYAPAAYVPAYKPKNDVLYTNKFALNLRAKVAEDVSVAAKLNMYKVWGSQGIDAVANGGSAPFAADRVGVFDGTLGHVPSSSLLNVDYAYATWSGIGGADAWFSVGRRPSTDGRPLHLKQNARDMGTAGVPALLVNYAFDGLTLGYAPDIDALPGAYAKFCYGRGFEAGYSKPAGNTLQDTDMIGITAVPYETENLRAWVQYNRGKRIFDAPVMKDTYFGNTAPKVQLGDIDWWGLGATGVVRKLGPGDLNWFADAAWSITHPNRNVSAQFGFMGLLTGGFFAPEAPTDKTGNAYLVGVRYDLPSRTKIGVEFNHGSKNWITFAPAADDMWTSKVGVRGNVWEVYAIQELNRAPIASSGAKAFFRLGFQYYDIKYTGSNNWVGAPVRISDVAGQFAPVVPLSKAYDLYGTFEVQF